MEKAFAILETATRDWGIELTDQRRLLMTRYVDALLEYNKTVNLTAETDASGVLLRHVADGLAAVPVLKRYCVMKEEAAPRICDVGSGGGFIGFGIKIGWPEAQVTLMESLDRKFKFLNLASARLGLKGLRVLKKRAGHDRLAAAETGFDAVTARALAPLPEALEICLPLVKDGGVFVAYLSHPPERGLAAVSARLVESHAYRLPLEESDRHLAVYRRGEA